MQSTAQQSRHAQQQQHAEAERTRPKQQNTPYSPLAYFFRQ